MDSALFERLSKRIDGYKDEMIEMQKKLISIPAIAPSSGGRGELQKGKYLEALLPKIFDNVTPLHAPDPAAEGGIRPNYACVLKGKSSQKTIWIMAHMDVVPEGEIKLWKSNPFEAVVKDGKVYGRGSEDNNQAVVSGYFAAKVFKDEGIIPNYNIGLLLVADEETGNEYGAKFILKNHKNLFGKDDVILVPDSGNPTGTDVEVAEKSRVWLKVCTHGKQAHASTPKAGVNTCRIGAHIIVKMDELDKLYGEKNPLFAPQDTSTFEPTMKSQNVANINTLPGEDVVYYDCRLLPSYDIEEFIGTFRKMANSVAEKLGATVDVELVSMAKAAPPTSPDNPIIQSTVEAAKAVYKVEARPLGIGGNTVAQYFREAGFPCAVYSRLDESLHGPNEYCILDNIAGDAKVWTYVFLNTK